MELLLLSLILSGLQGRTFDSMCKKGNKYYYITRFSLALNLLKYSYIWSRNMRDIKYEITIEKIRNIIHMHLLYI